MNMSSLIAAGKFRSKAVGPVSFGKSSKKETPGVTVKIQLLAGPNAGSTLDWAGWLGDATAERTSESLSLMGYDGDDPHSVVNGPEFDAVIEHEDYPAANGQTFQRARVQWINDPNGGSAGFVPMGATEVQSAKERLRIAAAAVKAKKNGQSALAPAPFEEEKF